mgnify:FL=1
MTNLNLIADESLGNIRGLGPLGDPQQPGALLEKLVSNVVGFMTVGGILWFTIQIIIAGYGWMTSGGDVKAAADARTRVINALIGLVVVFGALVLVSVVGYLLGVDVLKIGCFVDNLSIGTPTSTVCK